MLLRPVFAAIQEPFYLAGLKAVGRVSNCITTPFWNLVENKKLASYVSYFYSWCCS